MNQGQGAMNVKEKNICLPPNILCHLFALLGERGGHEWERWRWVGTERPAWPGQHEGVLYAAWGAESTLCKTLDVISITARWAGVPALGPSRLYLGASICHLG